MYKIKASGLQLSFNIIWIALNLVYNKEKLESIRLLIHRYTQFWFFREGCGNSFSTTFYVWFFKKNVSHIILYSLVKFHCLIAFISWNIGLYNCIAIISFPGCDVINFEINLICLIKPFFYKTKNSRQKFKYLENEKSF